MKTCIHEDCVVVWDELHLRSFEDITCPLCEAIKERNELKTDKELLERQIEDLEAREV